MAQELALEVRGVTVRYGERTIVDVEHLELCQGETLAVMGPNGAGKSTLLRVLGFLEPPSTGALFFQGRPVNYRRSEILELHRRTAFAFDESLLLDSDVRANVGIGLRLRGVRDRHDRVTAWMRRLGIDHLAARSARTLSSGEAQRVSLARALVLEPLQLVLGFVDLLRTIGDLFLVVGLFLRQNFTHLINHCDNLVKTLMVVFER